MTPDDWKRAMLAETQAVQDEVWAAETVRAAQALGTLEWLAPVLAAVLLAALTLLLGPNLNPGGWGVHSDHLFQWYSSRAPLLGLVFLGLVATLALALARLKVRAWLIVLVFAALPVLVALLGAVVYPPDAAVRSCVLDALRQGCVALDRQARPIHPGAWNMGVATLSALLAFVGASWGQREQRA